MVRIINASKATISFDAIGFFVPLTTINEIRKIPWAILIRKSEVQNMGLMNRFFFTKVKVELNLFAKELNLFLSIVTKEQILFYWYLKSFHILTKNFTWCFPAMRTNSHLVNRIRSFYFIFSRPPRRRRLNIHRSDRENYLLTQKFPPEWQQFFYRVSSFPADTDCFIVQNLFGWKGRHTRSTRDRHRAEIF